MRTKKFIVSVQETSRRTIEFDCEIKVPLEILNSNNEEVLDEYIQERIEDGTSNRYHFRDIVESELLDSEIIDVKEGTLPKKLNAKYSITI